MKQGAKNYFTHPTSFLIIKPHIPQILALEEFSFESYSIQVARGRD